jgi:hypothetical protein
MKKFAFSLLTLILISPTLVLASPGRTDANGCHTEKATGNYHCHSTPPVKEARLEARASAPLLAKTTAKDYNCPDFANQAEAQALFTQNTSDIYGLDADNDGMACEELK